MTDDARPAASTPPREPAGRLLLRLCAGIASVILLGGYMAHKLETQLQAPLSETWTGSAYIVAGAAYEDRNGNRIIAKGEPFLAATDRPAADIGHVEQLRDAGHRRVRIISHEVFADLPDAFRWSATLVATMGYADRRPATRPGRMLATVLMFMSASWLTGLILNLLAEAVPSFRSAQAHLLPVRRPATTDHADAPAARRIRSRVAMVAAGLFLAIGHLLPPMRAFLWFQLELDGALNALAVGLGGLLWLALLAIAVGVKRGNHACGLIASLWWFAGGGVGLYGPPGWTTALHVRPPTAYEHAAWVLGAVLMTLVYMQAVSHYAPMLRGHTLSDHTRNTPA